MLPSGVDGKIAFDNTGIPNDELSFSVLKGPNARSFSIKSSPGRVREFNLQLSENSTDHVYYKPGLFITRYSVDLWISLGILSVLYLLVFLVPVSFIDSIKGMVASSKFQKRLSSVAEVFNKIWAFGDKKPVAIFFLIFLFLGCVFFTAKNVNVLSVGPEHYGDEIRYWDTILSIYQGNFDITKYYRYPPVYYLSLLPAFYLATPDRVYDLAKLLNAIYLASVIFPVYLLLRKFLKRNTSLMVVALLLLNPIHLILPGRILSENIFYPILMWTVLLAHSDIFPDNKWNHLWDDIFLGISIGLLFLTRYIALVLIPVFILCWWFKPRENETETPPFYFSLKKVGRLVVVMLPILVMIAVWEKMGVSAGLRAKDMLGLFIAEGSNPKQLTFSRLVMWVVFYGSYLILLISPVLLIIVNLFSKMKLKDFRNDVNRWIILISLTIVALMVASIRHSWKMDYNYPLPLKLQGRYIFYAAPMFLITAFLPIKEEFDKKARGKFLVWASLLAVLAYGILNLGFIYLDKPLTISADSPMAELMRVFGLNFLIYILINFLVNTVFISRRKSLLLVLSIFLLVLYGVGDSRIIPSMANLKNKVENYQAHNLLFLNEDVFSDISRDEKYPLEIGYPDPTSSGVTNRWMQTLKFYGYDDVTMRDRNFQDRDGTVVFQAQHNGQIVTLFEIDQEHYLESQNEKYEFLGQYFEYQIE